MAPQAQLATCIRRGKGEIRQRRRGRRCGRKMRRGRGDKGAPQTSTRRLVPQKIREAMRAAARTCDMP